MKTYTEAAQTAHDSLIPLVDSAIASAKDRLSKATASADHDAIAPKLVALIDCADTPRGDAVPGMIQTYAALLNKPATTDGAFLIRHLASTVKHHGWNSEQAGQITCGGVLDCCQGTKDEADLKKHPAFFVLIAESEMKKVAQHDSAETV